MLLARNEGLARLALRIQGVEVLLETLLVTLTGINRAPKAHLATASVIGSLVNHCCDLARQWRHSRWTRIELLQVCCDDSIQKTADRTNVRL
jgi:hypothetical protein